jgi:hypothetical protein
VNDSSSFVLNNFNGISDKNIVKIKPIIREKGVSVFDVFSRYELIIPNRTARFIEKIIVDSEKLFIILFSFFIFSFLL